ncbi:beta-lactamase family protein [Gammaproteobacteria bacterium]|jgi:CubicO group peptidase (beta-lactamase class C family)|nr:beta-lactamase family protein [Gammaproteobacteria bacterium]
MFKSKWIFFSLIFFSLSVAANSYEASVSGMSNERLQKIAPSLNDLYLKNGKFPGFVSAVARKGKVVHYETIGFADLETGESLKKDSLFRIYSMSKPITGVALMILLEEGKLRLNDPVSLYIPEFGKTQVLIVNEDGTSTLIDQTKVMTIRDLATHTSGIAYDFTANKALAKIYRENELSPYFTINTPTKETLVSGMISSEKTYKDICSFAEALASKAPLMHQPSERYTYSMGMDVLGCIIERVSGVKFDEFLNTRIFKPLNMQDTFFSVPESKRDRFTTLYAEVKDLKTYMPDMGDSIPDDLTMLRVDGKQNSAYFKEATLFDGGSGLVSSTEDYLKFAQMLLNGGKLGDQRILSRKSVELMSGNHLPDTFSSDAYLETAGGYRRGAGIGLTVGLLTDPAKAGQYGSKGMFFWGGAASTIFWIDPEEELVAVLMTQVLGSSELLRETYSALVYQAIDD